MTRANTRIKTYVLIMLSLFCLGASGLKDKISITEVKVVENGAPRKIKVSTLTRGFDTYYHLKGISVLYGISFSYVPTKKRIIVTRGVNSLRLTIDAEPNLKNYYVYSNKKYFLSPEGLDYIFGKIMNGSVKYDKKIKVMFVSYEAIKKTASQIKKSGVRQMVPVPDKNIKVIPVFGGEKFEVNRIVLDAGHGGKDPGAVGKNGLQEKEVNLDIILRAAKLIKEKLKKEVILTRSKDVYISLQERTGIANKNKGDIFVAVHINANPDRNAEGTEVYIYDSEATDKKSGKIAVRENLDYMKTGGIKSILGALGSKSNDYLSIMLAGHILDNMVNSVEVTSRNKNMILRAPFYVLAHSEMPAVLLEVAFVTNDKEEQKLRDTDFREKVANAICSGVEDFISAATGQAPDVASTDTLEAQAKQLEEYRKAGYKEE